MPLDATDLEQIGKLIAEAQKKAAEESAKALEAQLAKQAKGLQSETEKRLEALKAETEKRFGEIPKPTDPPKDPPGNEDSPLLKKLQADLDAMRKQAEAQSKRAEEAEQKRAAELLTSGTRDALIAAGADPKRVHLALPVLQTTGRVKLNDKGVPVMVFQRNGYEETLPIADGAKEWLGTDDGKLYVPPAGTQGTGDGTGGTGGRSGFNGNPEQIALNALANLL